MHIPCHIVCSIFAEVLNRVTVFFNKYLVFVDDMDGGTHILSSDEMLGYLQSMAEICVNDLDSIDKKLIEFFTREEPDWKLSLQLMPVETDVTINSRSYLFFPMKELLEASISIRCVTY